MVCGWGAAGVVTVAHAGRATQTRSTLKYAEGFIELPPTETLPQPLSCDLTHNWTVGGAGTCATAPAGNPTRAPIPRCHARLPGTSAITQPLPARYGVAAGRRERS